MLVSGVKNTGVSPSTSTNRFLHPHHFWKRSFDFFKNNFWINLFRIFLEYTFRNTFYKFQIYYCEN